MFVLAPRFRAPTIGTLRSLVEDICHGAVT